MNQTIDIANKLGANFGSGDAQVDAAAQEGKPSVDAFGNQGQPGQYAAQGQYGGVTGGGFGGGLAKDSEGKPLAERKHRDSAYEGMEHGDSTSTGGYGKNAQGGAFSRQNQMGADNTAAVFDDEDNEGRKTGYSTPGYLKEGEDPEAADRRNNVNVYGKQADDRGAANPDEPNN